MIKKDRFRFNLIGSRATGNAREEADIDVIIVSNYFSEIPFIKRMELLLKMAKFSN
jgi:predicted nucleotidyltransferase